MSRCWLLAVAVIVTSARMLAAQSLDTGTWNGMLEWPDGDSALVTVTASRDDGHLAIAVRSSLPMAWDLGGIREEPGRLRFAWALDGPDPLLCDLTYRRQDRWEGRCDDTVRGADGRLLRLLLTLTRMAAPTPE